MEVENNVEPIFLYGFDASVNAEDIKRTHYYNKFQTFALLSLMNYLILLKKIKLNF